MGGAKAPLPPPGSAPDYCAAVNYLAIQIHICEGVFWGGRGGHGPLGPPPPGSAPAPLSLFQPINMYLCFIGSLTVIINLVYRPRLYYIVYIRPGCPGMPI